MQRRITPPAVILSSVPFPDRLRGRHWHRDGNVRRNGGGSSRTATPTPTPTKTFSNADLSGLLTTLRRMLRASR